MYVRVILFHTNVHKIKRIERIRAISPPYRQSLQFRFNNTFPIRNKSQIRPKHISIDLYTYIRFVCADLFTEK